MLIHEKFVFLHMPKTGGSFVGNVLKRELPGSLTRGAPGKLHPGWGDLPDEARGRPVLVYVRNPWDWYVSWYHAVSAKELAAGKSVVSGVNDFETAIRKACTGLLNPPAWQPRPVNGEADFYTTRLLHLCGAGWQSENLFFGRFESLRGDLERFLSAAGVPLSDTALSRLHSAEPVNSSSHKPYREYYEAALRDLVADACRIPIERFGYRF
jgi:hypothetical protein